MWYHQMIKYILAALLSGVFSAFSQVLLKKSSNAGHRTRLGEYLNFYVISGYALVFLCMVLMIYAYKGLPFKYGAVMESLVYLYVMILGRLFFKEKITRKKVLGNLLIVCGVIVFSL